jgi:hypothetical protein
MPHADCEQSSAYTQNPTRTPDGKSSQNVTLVINLTKLVVGWTTVLCPKFFNELKYLNEYLAGPKISEESFGDPKKSSYEQNILHEVSISIPSLFFYDSGAGELMTRKQWLHADVMEYSGKMHRKLWMVPKLTYVNIFQFQSWMSSIKSMMVAQCA